MIDELLTAFQGAGGEAIEVASGSQTRDDDALFAAKAKQYGFLASTGSDWHSPRSPRPTPGSQPQVPADLTPIWTKFGFPKRFLRSALIGAAPLPAANIKLPPKQ